MEEKMNKRGWIKIVEAVIAIVLLAGLVLFVIGQRNVGESDVSTVIYDLQVSVLRGIQLDNTLRAEIINPEETEDEVEWEDENFPTETKSKIISETPNYLTCEAKICDPGTPCLHPELPEGDVYTESVLITPTLSYPDSRVLKMFCWEN